MQKRRNSVALAMELRLSCINPSNCVIFEQIFMIDILSITNEIAIR